MASGLPAPLAPTSSLQLCLLQGQRPWVGQVWRGLGMGTYSTPSHGTLLISLGLRQAKCLGLGQGLVNLLGDLLGRLGW